MSAMVAAFAASSMIFSLVFKYSFRVKLDDPLLRHNTAQYLLMLACVGCGVGLICSLFAVKLPLKESLEQDEENVSNKSGETPLRIFLYLEFWMLIVCTFFIASSGYSL
jgi:phosphate starvation-inducible membrane PsiE